MHRAHAADGLHAASVPAQCWCADERCDEALRATRIHDLAILVGVLQGVIRLFNLALALDIERPTRELAIGAVHGQALAKWGARNY